MSEKPIDPVDGSLPVDTQGIKDIGTVKPDSTWLCPVCGLKRNIGSHKKCSKITQLKYMKARGEI
jgi:rubredoxin